MTINLKQCPKCGSKNSVPIVYCMPGPELFEEAEAGKVKLGGCCIIDGNPEFHCNNCGLEWNRDEALAAASVNSIESSWQTILLKSGAGSEVYLSGTKQKSLQLEKSRRGERS